MYPDDVVHEDGIVDIVKAVAPSLLVSQMPRAFVAGGPQQTFGTVVSKLSALGFKGLNISSVLSSVDFMPLNPGVAYGYVRVFPETQDDLTPMDIVLFNELPLDLTVVAGTVTTVFQDLSSHVNLKAKERGTPNMMLRNISLLATFKDKPVRLTVTKGAFTVEASTDEEVRAAYAKRLNEPWNELPYAEWNSSVWYADMCSRLSSKCVSNGPLFGGKAAMLGFLEKVLGRVSDPNSPSHQLGYDLVPQGFGAPLTWYRWLVSSNPLLNSTLTDLITQERAGMLSPRQRRDKSAIVRSLFYNATIPAAVAAELAAQVKSLKKRLPGIKKLKCRSSANAEDIVGFDGAGLHDSFSVKLKVTEEDDRENGCLTFGSLVRLKMHQIAQFMKKELGQLRSSKSSLRL